MSERGVFLRTVRIVAMATFLLGALAAPAAAAPPANDDRGDAATVGALPFKMTVDTSEATPQDNDPDCSNGPNDPTVWWSFTPSESGRYGVTTFRSEYDTTLVVAMPNAGGLDIVDCVDDTGALLSSSLIWHAEAGQEYLIMAGSCCGEQGGLLRLELRKDPRRVNAQVTIAGKGVVNRKGAAVIHGRVECQHGAGAEGFLGASITQVSGRLVFRGSRETGLRCDRGWVARMPGNIGRFAPGRATARGEILACAAFGCDSDTERRTVRLESSD